MPNPMVAVAGGSQVIGAVTGQKGAKKAAQAEQYAQQQAIDLQRETRDLSLANLKPFLQAGTGGLAGLTAAANAQTDPNAFYQNYFQSPEYAQLSDQANRNILASREATGGLRTTSTANLLGSIAPQLAQSAFARQQALQDANYNRQMGLVNVGLNAAGGSNAVAGNAANAIGNLFLQQGQSRAGQVASQYQAQTGLFGDLTKMISGGF